MVSIQSSILLLPLLIGLGLHSSAQEPKSEPSQEPTVRTVHTKGQPRPGAPEVEFDMRVISVPVDPPRVAAAQAKLSEDALVLGIVRDGESLAIPIGLLANFEVLNTQVGKLPIAPTW